MRLYPELVTPPLPIKELRRVYKIENSLREEGAHGTADAIRFAFGAQLNPEVVSLDVKSILNYLRSYLVMSAWLKHQIQVDFTRKMTFFASDFPTAYQKKVLNPDYSPSLSGLIDDYLESNDTRNRGLDMLPLFAFIDEDKVKKAVPNQKVNKRPTFHYRLPNCQISLPTWSVEIEWLRWQLVEKVAEDKKTLEQLSQRYLCYLNAEVDYNDEHWLIELNCFVERYRK